MARYLVCAGIYPPEVGGAATAAQALVQGLQAQGHEVSVCTYGSSEGRPGVRCVSRSGGALLRYARFAAMVRRLLCAETVVIATDIFSVGIPVRLALIGRRNRFIIRLGGEWYWEDAVNKGRFRRPLRLFWQTSMKGFRRTLARFHYAWILRRTERIRLTSFLLQEVIKDLVPDVLDKAEIVSNLSIDPDVRRFVSPEAKPHKPLRLICIGRFAPVKNLPFLARVLRTLVASDASFTMEFIGDGEEMSEVKAILGERKNIAFLGAMTREATLQHLALADLLLLPSLSDLSPNAVVEALALGVPCLVTREHGLPRPIAGIKELDPEDEGAWIEALSHLFRDAEAYKTLQQSIDPSSFLSKERFLLL